MYQLLNISVDIKIGMILIFFWFYCYVVDKLGTNTIITWLNYKNQIAWKWS